jgi:DNA phosphorothioation-associated putative methyltransferase
VSIGKQIGSALYVHRSAVEALPRPCQALLLQAEYLFGEIASFEANVLKIDAASSRVSFLQYGDFFDDPFPSLLTATNVDLLARRQTTRNYRHSRNPPILHRKELLLLSTDPHQSRFRKLTESLRHLGLYSEAHRIGYLRQWAERLVAAGVGIQDHSVVKLSDAPELSVDKPW